MNFDIAPTERGKAQCQNLLLGKSGLKQGLFRIFKKDL